MGCRTRRMRETIDYVTMGCRTRRMRRRRRRRRRETTDYVSRMPCSRNK